MMSTIKRELRNWRCVKGNTFTGELYTDGRYECDCIIATVSIMVLDGYTILEENGRRYTLWDHYKGRR